MSEFADLEFGNAEGVAVVGGDQGAGEFVDLGGGGGTDGVGEGLSRANFLGGERGRGHEKASVAGTHFSPRQRTLPWCTRIPPTYKTLTAAGRVGGNSLDRAGKGGRMAEIAGQQPGLEVS